MAERPGVCLRFYTARAINGLMHRSKQHLYSILFDHLVSARDELHKRLTLICINAVARKHKRDVLATPQHVEIKRRVKCLKCEYSC
jgi:hypothetical protein